MLPKTKTRESELALQNIFANNYTNLDIAMNAKPRKKDQNHETVNANLYFIEFTVNTKLYFY